MKTTVSHEAVVEESSFRGLAHFFQYGAVDFSPTKIWAIGFDGRNDCRFVFRHPRIPDGFQEQWALRRRGYLQRGSGNDSSTKDDEEIFVLVQHVSPILFLMLREAYIYSCHGTECPSRG
ncbi:MAG: hypothetical protein AAB386_04510 [Patescibacteria group bacterium]